jgi:hypothetical protein
LTRPLVGGVSSAGNLGQRSGVIVLVKRLLPMKLPFVTLIVVFAAACSSGGGHDVVVAPPSSTTTGAAVASPTTSTVALTASDPGRPPAACAPRLSESVDNPGVAGLAHKMVPIPATAARVCRYAPLDAKVPNALERSGLTGSSSAVQHLEAVTNALHHISNTERIPCPLNPSTPGWTIAFTAGRASVTLVVAASDCGFVTNGTLSAGPTTSWLDALGRIATGR